VPGKRPSVTLRPATATEAPASASPMAMSRPRPRLAPATKATLPSTLGSAGMMVTVRGGGRSGSALVRPGRLSSPPRRPSAQHRGRPQRRQTWQSSTMFTSAVHERSKRLAGALVEARTRGRRGEARRPPGGPVRAQGAVRLCGSGSCAAPTDRHPPSSPERRYLRSQLYFHRWSGVPNFLRRRVRTLGGPVRGHARGMDASEPRTTCPNAPSMPKCSS
jgi:hypothetical protein